MKILVTIGLNRLSSWHIISGHITLFTVSYFFSEILRIPDDGRNRNLEIFYSFFQETHRDTTTELYNPWRKFFKKSVKYSCVNYLGKGEETLITFNNLRLVMML